MSGFPFEEKETQKALHFNPIHSEPIHKFQATHHPRSFNREKQNKKRNTFKPKIPSGVQAN